MPPPTTEPDGALPAAPPAEPPAASLTSGAASGETPGLAAARAESLSSLEWPRLLAALAARLGTPFGRGALAALAPLPKLGAVRHALARVAEMQALRAARGALPLGGVQALEGLLERAERGGRLEADELAAVLAAQRTALQVCAALQSLPQAPALAELAGALHPLRELVERLGTALTPTGTLDERAFPKLGRLRGEIDARRDGIHRHLERLLRSPKLAGAFQDRLYTVRGRRYVLPVKADFKGHLPGIVHDVSASGATLFMEPQAVVEETNALTLTERLLELEQDRILRELSAQVGQAAAPLAANLAWLGQVDLIHAQAALAEAYAGTVPRVEAAGELDLRGVAHPLLLIETHTRGADLTVEGAPHVGPDDPADGDTEDSAVVRNDLRLGGEARCMVISGANTGGKTVLLKAVGLCALLVRHGMPIPARAGSRCDWFAEVWADIGDQQSLAGSLSTFSAQIHFLTHWLPHTGPEHLVLLDEMLTGTEPAQGAALAAGVLEALLDRGATTLVTTHFGELKELAAGHEGLVNASMAFDMARLRPTYRLQVGLPGASYAAHIARRYGLPEPIVARAEALLAQRPAVADALLVQLAERQRDLERAEERQRDRERRHDAAEQSIARTRAELDARARELRRRERGAIGEELRQAKRRIGAVTRELQQANSLPTVSRLRHRLTELEGVLERELNAREGAEPRRDPSAPPPLRPDVLKPGAALWVPALQRGAVLEALLDEGRRARVQLGALTFELALDELAAPPAAPPATPPARSPPRPAPGERAPTGRAASALPPPQRGGARGDAVGQAGAGGGAALHGAGAGGGHGELPQILFALSTEENTLDVRGLRLEDAQEQVEQFFDRCTMKHVSPVMVIHGHGTGRLKAGLRERLQDSPYVEAFRPGGAGEGRDGVTIVALAL